jgi:hypothetical protein
MPEEEPFDPKTVKMCIQSSDSSEKETHKTVGGDPKRMRAAFMKNKIWPAFTKIKIGFYGDGEHIPRTDIGIMEKKVDSDGNSLKMDPLQKVVEEMKIVDSIIKIVTERIQPVVNLKLEFYDENKELINVNTADIRIDFDDYGGAWSLLGTECLKKKHKGKPTMNFGWFDVGTVLHEFCHALGMVHEHQNPKGKVILWDVPRLEQWAQEMQGWDADTTREQIVKRYASDEINGSTFDSKSIMLYFFPGNVVLDPNTNKCCGTGTNQNMMFSPYDVLYLNYNYPFKDTSVTSEQFTVKFFNDVFNQQVDIEDLKNQLENSKKVDTAPVKKDEEEFQEEGEKKEEDGSKEQYAMRYSSTSRSSPSSSSSFEVKEETAVLCKPGCIPNDHIMTLSILFTVIVILCIIIAISMWRCRG